jgi:dephospho-CoA kinase
VRRVGLTGGIATGKSTVSARLVEHGAVLVDSDAIAREVVAAGTPGLAEVIEAFGDDVVAPSGELDRPALGRIVFADPAARARLEAIVHPLVRRRSAALAAEAEAAGVAVVVFDIPLLVETSQQQDFDEVVVVEAPEQVQVERLTRDRGLTPEDATARIRAQATPAQRRAAADHVLVNDGSVGLLLERVDALWDQLVSRRA